jgi:hypothetical protein
MIKCGFGSTIDLGKTHSNFFMQKLQIKNYIQALQKL